MTSHSIAAIVAVATAVSTGGGAPGATDWPSANYDQTANRYSPLTQITVKNVGTLQQVWSFHLKPAGFTGPMREDEAIPIVIGNTMYLGSPYGAVIALDATTGAQKWRFQLPDNELPSKRGVAYWPGGGSLPLPPSIVFGSTTGKMYSLKAADGTLNEWFGENGVVNLKTPEVMQTGTNLAYSLLSSPTIYKDLIITGAGTGEGPGGSTAGAGPAGDTRAWDARTGKLVWTFHTVPRPGEFGYDTWGGDSARNRSGVNVWGYTSLDAERGILYMPLGAPNNDRVGIDRPGNNLFSSSVVAVDANSGKYLWHFQLVHHDIWDYDTQSAPLLVDLRRDGQIVPAVIVVNKTGLMFTFNRVTGKPLFDIEERPVPKSDVPGEQASATQPFPVKPEPLTQNTISRNNLYKGEPQHQSYCEHLVDDNNMKLGGPYLPIAFNQYSISPPGPAGGINFWGPAYDPELHLFVSNTSNIFQPMRIIQRPDGSYANSGPLAGTRRFGDPDRKLLCGPTPWGELVAVNMDTGNMAYRKTLGVSDALPAGMQDTGRPSSGGVVLTASGLTFVGGTDDFRFRAFATATGEKLWEIKLPSSVETTPITYLGADGRQFVTVVSTGGGLTGSAVTNDEIIAFALPKSPQSAADTWTTPRTPDGHPDLQGLWTTHTFTPLVRPARYADQEFLTEQEASELSALLTQDEVDPLVAGIFGASDEERRKRIVQNDPTHYDNALWLATPDLKPLSSNRTSLIYDPPDGKIPPVTPDARGRAAARRAVAGFDSYENRPLQERCIIWTHEGPPMLPPPYNDVLQIVQTPGYVLVVRELATAPRLIRTDGRPHVSENIRQWAGDSRGRWEGDTLVVDTTNFTHKTAFQGSSSALHVVERFTRVSADRILYRFTVDDPETWTRPWSAEIPMIATRGPLFEYACHEGNYGMPDILRGARYTEKQAVR